MNKSGNSSGDDMHQDVELPDPSPFKTAAELIGLTNGTAAYCDEVHHAISTIVSDLECVGFNVRQKQVMKNRIMKEIMPYLEAK